MDPALLMLCSSCRMMWAAGAVAAMSSITFPAISAIVSRNADPDQQGKLVTDKGGKTFRWILWSCNRGVTCAVQVWSRA